MGASTRERDGILFVKYTGTVSADDVRGVIATVRAVTGRKKPFGIVVDTLNAEPLGAVQRKLLADAFRDDADLHRAYLKACGMIFGSVIMRGVMTAISWISPPAFPTEVFATVDQAEEWVRRALSCG